MKVRHRKVLVIGCSGAGKSTLSRALGERWKLPVYHLDALYWKPGWVPTPKEEFLAKLQGILGQLAWLIDGNFDSTLEMRAREADLIVFLDFSTWRCLSRVVKRAWTYRGKTRPDMGEGCPEKIDWEFVHWISRFPKEVRPTIIKILQNTKAECIILKKPKEVETWLEASPIV